MSEHNESPSNPPAPSSHFVQVWPSEVAAYGPVAALVLGAIRFRSNEGHVDASRSVVAGWVGLSADQVGRAVRKLVDVGAIEVTRPRSKHGDQTGRYSLPSPGISHNAKSPSPECAIPPSPDAAEIKNPEYAKSPSLPLSKNLRINQLRNDGKVAAVPAYQPSMLPDDGIPTRNEVNHSRQMREAAFNEWWARWPKKLGRKKDALRAWEKALAEGLTSQELHLRLDRYLAAYEWWNETYPGTPARQLHATTFLNGGHLDYDEVCYPSEKAQERWGHLRRHLASPAAGPPEEQVGTPEWIARKKAERIAAERGASRG